MRYSIILDAGGAISLSEQTNASMNLWSGDTILGYIGASVRDLPLHSLANNVDAISHFGLTLASSDFVQKYTVDGTAFLDWYYKKGNLLARMREMIGPNKWVVYSIGVSSSNRLTANFGIVIPLALQNQRFVISCNGRESDDINFTIDPHLAISHWFMPSGCVLGCRAIFESIELSDYLKFTISFPDCADNKIASKFLPLFSYTNPSLLDGLPDTPRIRRVSGPVANQNSYLNGGKTAAERISAIIDNYHQHDGRSRQVLDWGVGCGRVAIHFGRKNNMEISGIDIDRDNLDWCRSNLPGRYEVVDLFPPTPFRDASFDVIYSCSVLSHLTEDVARLWLSEIARLLTNDGIALLSFNGSANLCSYLSRRPLLMHQALEDGIFDADINHDLDGFIPSSDYYRATFSKTSWWIALFEEFFELIAIEPSVVSGYQDVAVLKTKSKTFL